jgi:hypothetical protein
MDESALRAAIARLESTQSSLHWWLEFWTALVVLGVAVEVVFVVWEHKDDLDEFRAGVMQPPNIWLFVLALFGSGLVAGGVAGELFVGSKIGGVETQIRKANGDLNLLLSKEAGDAAQSAKEAQQEADAVRIETADIEKRLAVASNHLGIIEERVRVQGPRWRILDDNTAAFIRALKPYIGSQLTVLMCGGPLSPIEQMTTEQPCLTF